MVVVVVLCDCSGGSVGGSRYDRAKRISCGNFGWDVKER